MAYIYLILFGLLLVRVLPLFIISLVEANKETIPREDYNRYAGMNNAVEAYMKQYYAGREFSYLPDVQSLEIYEDDLFSESEKYQVIFSRYSPMWGGLKVFTLHRPDKVSGEERSLNEKRTPKNKRVHRRNAIVNCCEKKRFNESSAKAFFAGVFQTSTERLIDLGHIAEKNGEVSVYGADFNKNVLPNKKELRIIAEEFENAGFKVMRINYKTGEFILKLQEA